MQNDKKDYVSGLMNADPEVWNRRPLSDEMIDYAAQDVMYLPWLMTQLVEKLEKCFIAPELVISQAARYNDYAEINLEVEEKPEKGQIITGVYKNSCKFGVFIATNLGFVGMVRDKHSKKMV